MLLFDIMIVAIMLAECLNGFPAALLPLSNGKQQEHLLSGSYIFPNMTIQCQGRITAIDVSVYFDPDVHYSSNITAKFVFYTLLNFQYKPKRISIVQVNLKSYLQHLPKQFFIDASGRYYVSKPLVVSASFGLSIPLQVYPGYILGLSLPPTESIPGIPDVSHGISIGALNDNASETLASSYWNGYENPRASGSWFPVKGMIPVVQMEFTKSAAEEGNYIIGEKVSVCVCVCCECFFQILCV